MTAAEQREAAAAKREALRKARSATLAAQAAWTRRDRAIREAALVASYSEIAGAVGLSKGRVAVIVTSDD